MSKPASLTDVGINPVFQTNIVLKINQNPVLGPSSTLLLRTG